MARRSGTRRKPSTSLSSAPRARRKVLLPEPLLPRSATNSPDRISRSSPSRTTLSPNAFWMLRATTTVSVNVSVAVICSPPGEQPAFDEAHHQDRNQPEDRVHGDQHEHHVDLEVLARIGHHPA